MQQLNSQLHVPLCARSACIKTPTPAVYQQAERLIVDLLHVALMQTSW